MQATKIWMALAVCAGLGACGESMGEQAIIGGAAGLGTAALLDGDVLTGAAAGAAANVIYCQANPEKCN